MKHVAKVLIVDGAGEYLLLLRGSHPHFPNDPDLPGGSVEEGESFKEAAVREVWEEAAIDLSGKTLTELYEGKDFSTHGTIYSLYVCKLDNRPEVKISWEHASYAWMTHEKVVELAGEAADTYMHMVHDVLTKSTILKP